MKAVIHLPADSRSHFQRLKAAVIRSRFLISNLSMDAYPFEMRLAIRAESALMATTMTSSTTAVA